METTVTVLLFLSLFGLNFTYRKHIFVKDKKNWKDAQKYCRTHYDDLSTITAQDLWTLCNNSEIVDGYFYFGLQKDLQNSGWMWSDGSPASINEWDKNQGTTGENCGAIQKSNAKIHDFVCSTKLSFYCMLDLDLVLEQKTWDEALDYCTQLSTGLISINSRTIMDLVLNVAAEAQTVNVWIGLRFLVARWFWVNGDALQYEAWSPEGQTQCPAVNQRCGALDRNRMVWTTTSCQERLNFVCSLKRK